MILNIFLLGQFKLLANDIVFDLPSRSAQSLLAILALNAGVAYRREKLAGLLWPEASESNARGYLRQALWRIRKSLEKAALSWHEYLTISDINIAFNEKSDYWLDVNLLLEPPEAQTVEQIIDAVSLYHGEFLPGFYDDWVVPERDRLLATYHRKMGLLLTRLRESRRWEDALQWAEVWLQLGHSPEPAFRALMLAHAGLGNHSMVSAAYQRCVEVLNRELGLDPSPETRMLYEKIIREQVEEYEAPPDILTRVVDQRPGFFDDTGTKKLEKTVFVACKRELDQLSSYLDLALAGKGRVAFITGEAGSGKTTVIQEFTRQAQETYPELIVVSGNCNAHTGLGDPYLPFREILGMLTGDVESRWAAGAITKEHARRLWRLFPFTAEAIIEFGPELINTFIPAVALLNRARVYGQDMGGWQAQLKAAESKIQSSFIPGPQQSDIFEQYSRVLRALARKAAFVLVLDDLQWADAGSIGLLFHLGRQLSGYPILILGAYRREEVALGREGARHPLEPVVNEFKRQSGAISVDLEKADRRAFVEAFLDSEQNRLGPEFREMLHRQTHGHPLFTIELLRGMQARGDLVLDPESRWVEGPVLDWETMPARVEAVIAERIGRLPRPLQTVMQVASVEGEVFTAEVVAQVLQSNESMLLAHLSGELDRVHHLIRAESIQRLGSRLLSSYRFRNILFQKYLYGSLDRVERVHLHEQIGNALEGLYTDPEETAGVALQLARHFEEAGMMEKATDYLHQAGERAIHLLAYEEGLAHLSKGLEILDRLPASPWRDQQELKLLVSIAMAYKYQRPTPKRVAIINRARDFCQRLGKTNQLSRILGELAIYNYVHAEHLHALEFGFGALSLAQQAHDPMLEVEAHWCLGFIQFCLGDYVSSKTHLEQVISFYDPELHHRLFLDLRGVDVGLSALAYEACCLWCLGYPDQAARVSQKALSLARDFDHPFTLVDVLSYAGCMFNLMRRDGPALQESAQALSQVAQENKLMGFLEMGINAHGESLVLLGQVQEGIDRIRQGMAISDASNVKLNKALILRSLAKALADAGHVQSGLEILTEALEVVEQTGGRHWEVELYRLRSEFFAAHGDDLAAETSSAKAIEVSRRQQAKSWELRASTGLARLWQKQGRTAEARQLLAPVYDWFTEGFDTPDMKEARAVLLALS
jgi:DNA-binding SARP family transcriptional activator